MSIRRLYALFVLWLLPALVQAAPPACWPDIPAKFSKIEVTAPELGDILYSASSVGLVWGYTCKAADGTWHKVIAGGPWTAFPIEWAYIADTALRGTDAERRALWDKYATATAWDERLKPDLDAVWAKLPSPPPPPPPVTWRVLADPFRADKKRLVYSVVSGKRGPPVSPAQYVEAGAACDPAVTIEEFGSTFFLSVNGNPATIARCVKQ